MIDNLLRRALAVGLGSAAVGAFVLAGNALITARSSENAYLNELASQLSAWSQRKREAIASLQSRQDQLGPSRIGVVLSVGGTDADLAGLQERVRSQVLSSGGNLIAIEARKQDEDADLTRFAVTIRAQLDEEAILGFVDTMEGSVPQYFLENWEIRPNYAGAGNGGPEFVATIVGFGVDAN